MLGASSFARDKDLTEKPSRKNENTFGKSLLFVSMGNNGPACVQWVVVRTVLSNELFYDKVRFSDVF